MRIPSAARITSGRSVALASALCIAAGLGFGTVRGPVLSITPAFAFDGTSTPNTAALLHGQRTAKCMPIAVTAAAAMSPAVASVPTTGKSFLSSSQRI